MMQFLAVRQSDLQPPIGIPLYLGTLQVPHALEMLGATCAQFQDLLRQRAQPVQVLERLLGEGDRVTSHRRGRRVRHGVVVERVTLKRRRAEFTEISREILLFLFGPARRHPRAIIPRECNRRAVRIRGWGRKSTLLDLVLDLGSSSLISRAARPVKLPLGFERTGFLGWTSIIFRHRVVCERRCEI